MTRKITTVKYIGEKPVFRLSELAPHWRKSKPDDPRLLDHIHLILLLKSYEYAPEWNFHERMLALAAIDFQIIDDRKDPVARRKAREHDEVVKLRHEAGVQDSADKFTRICRAQRAKLGLKPLGRKTSDGN